MRISRVPTFDWQNELAQGFDSPIALLKHLRLENHHAVVDWPSHQCFKTKVPRGFVQRMQVGNMDDPLLKQVLPTVGERQKKSGFCKDPLAEEAANVQPGILHKYYGRVLLTLAGGCAINCRYCFRRHFDYAANQLNLKQWIQSLDYLRNDNSIHEVILSGGDPLLRKDDFLQMLIEQLSSISHLKTLRIHSRIPIVLPERITQELGSILAASRLNVVLVVHCNHSQELDENVEQAMHLLREAQVHLLNQSVLLAGINDDLDILATLSHSLFAIGILPYYLHLLDPIEGTAHFFVCENKATSIMASLREKLPGYLVPRLAKEEAFKKAKSIIAA